MRFLVLIMLMVVLLEARGRNQSPSDLAYENCTQIVAEMLLRQETTPSQIMNLGRNSAASTLAAMASLLNQLRIALLDGQHTESFHAKQCSLPYTLVGKNCLLLAIGQKLTWASALQYCTNAGGELATFSDANTYAEYLGFVYSINADNTPVNVWIGGRDEDLEGTWTWHNGGLMPRGPPFWGSTNSFRAEPGGARAENCAILYHADKYYVHDISCTSKAAPLCRKQN